MKTKAKKVLAKTPNKLYKKYDGPTDLARAMVEQGKDDDAIMEATGGAIKGAQAARAKWPHLFTRSDLGRLRERMKAEQKAVA
jgi:hypothetical protein